MHKTRRSGISAAELFKRGEGITYDDFNILDTEFTDIDRGDINLKTDLGKGIYLNIPIISSPMDTVTNAALCIALGLEGGIGCLHYNHKKPDGSVDIDQQIREIELVKRFESGFIEDPIVLSPENTIAQAIGIGEKYNVGKGFIDTFPVTEGGLPHGKLLGMLRKQDFSRAKHTELKVKDRMVPLEKLLQEGQVSEWPITLSQANKKIWDLHVLSLPISEKNGNLKYLVTRADLDKNEEFPNATKDDKKRIRVLFAIETWEKLGYERAERGFAAGADGVVPDTSQGFTKYSFNMLKYLVKKYPDKLIIGGNTSTPEAYRAIAKLNVDLNRLGQGSGASCTTIDAIGIGRAGAAGVYDCTREKSKLKILTDGGLKKVSDIVKALTIGADCVMLGYLLAGTEESPGETIIDSQSGLPIKVYRGMGSKEANVGGGLRGYSRLPQGVSGHVNYRGSVHSWIPLITDGLTSALHTLNCSSIDELHKKMYSGEIRFERRTLGSMNETGVGDLIK